MSKKIRVFVYGTLKKGFGADHLMQPGEVVAANVPLLGYRMYHNGSYPMAVPGSPSDKVIGEVWEVDESALRSLDAYEGHPNLFKRTPIDSIGASAYIFQHGDYLQEGGYSFVADGIFR